MLPVTSACKPSKLRRMSQGGGTQVNAHAGRQVHHACFWRTLSTSRRGSASAGILQPVAGGENQFDRRGGLVFRCFYQGEPDGLLTRRAQLLAPHVERMFFQRVFHAKGADALAALFLLGNSLAPPLAPFRLFGSTYFPTMRRLGFVHQRGSCDGYRKLDQCGKLTTRLEISTKFAFAKPILLPVPVLH